MGSRSALFYSATVHSTQPIEDENRFKIFFNSPQASPKAQPQLNLMFIIGIYEPILYAN